jgi:hypothetical protein
VIGNFTNCKVWNGNAVWLHGGASGGHEQGTADPFGFAGPKNERTANSQIFKIDTDQLARSGSISAVIELTGCRSLLSRFTAQ